MSMYPLQNQTNEPQCKTLAWHSGKVIMGGDVLFPRQSVHHMDKRIEIVASAELLANRPVKIQLQEHILVNYCNETIFHSSWTILLKHE